MSKKEKKRIAIDDSLIDSLARLSSVELPAQERRALRSDLEEIVAYVKRLDELALDDINSSSRQVSEKTHSQPDVPKPGLLRRPVFSNAPDIYDGFFKAPPIIKR